MIHVAGKHGLWLCPTAHAKKHLLCMESYMSSYKTDEAILDYFTQHQSFRSYLPILANYCDRS